MATYRLSAQVIGRSAGRSAVAAAAYRAAERLVGPDGRVHDYTRKQGVAAAFVVAPAGAPAWAADREALWNAAENAERRKDAQLARELQLSLPHELTDEQRQQLVEGFVREQLVGRGMVADVALHEPEDGGRNHHAHVLATTRRIGAQGFEAKAREWNSKEVLQAWREAWAEHVNRALDAAGHEARVDHRTLAAQGIERAPEPKVGVAGMAMERRGEWSWRAQWRHDVRAANIHCAPRSAEVERPQQRERPHRDRPTPSAAQAEESRAPAAAPPGRTSRTVPAPVAAAEARLRQAEAERERWHGAWWNIPASIAATLGLWRPPCDRAVDDAAERLETARTVAAAVEAGRQAAPIDPDNPTGRRRYRRPESSISEQTPEAENSGRISPRDSPRITRRDSGYGM